MTALVSAFGRAYHSLHDNPKIFNDYLARELITDDEFAEISGYMSGGIKFFNPEKANDFPKAQEALKWVIQTQIAPTPLARARYCEEMLNNAIMIGAKQYVILGAGIDSFAYRNPDLRDKIQIFEVDHPATQKFKKSRIKKAGWDIPNNLHFVSVDFTTDNIAEELKKAGFDYAKCTFFSWLGVTYYLIKENILQMLKLISSISVKGSSIFFDYADEDLFCSEVKRVQNMVAMAQSTGEPMKSCYSYAELEAVLDEAGLLIYEHLTPQDIESRYFQNRNDYLHAFENIDYVLAVVK